MKNTTRSFWQVVAVALALPFIFAILDVAGARMWGLIGGWEGTAYTTAMMAYQNLFWTFAYVVIAAIAGTYYLIRRDKSEAVALLAIPYILLQFGAEDVYFYFISNIQIWDKTMPWLTQNLWPPTLLSWTFGQPIITGPILILSAVIGYAISYITARQLVKAKW